MGRRFAYNLMKKIGTELIILGIFLFYFVVVLVKDITQSFSEFGKGRLYHESRRKDGH